VAELFGRGDQQIVELVKRGGARLQRAGSGHTQLPDRFHDPVRLFRHRGRCAAQCCAGGELGVDRVALAEPLSGMRVRLIDLDDRDRVGSLRVFLCIGGWLGVVGDTVSEVDA
jgi:hypothetical protein